MLQSGAFINDVLLRSVSYAYSHSLHQESITVPPDATVAETIKLMLKRRVGAVVVVHGKLVQGIFTERDVLKKVR